MDRNKKEVYNGRSMDRNRKEANKARNKKKKQEKAKAALMKAIPVVVAIVLIIAVIGIFYGQKIIDKYSYSKEYENLFEYYDLVGDKQMAVVINDEKCTYKGVYQDGVAYLPFVLVEEKFSDHFYLNTDERILLYATATEIYKAEIGLENKFYYCDDAKQELDYAPVMMMGEEVFVAADYLAKFVGFTYDYFSQPDRMNVYTKEMQYPVVVAKKDTAVRTLGGVKSPILEDVLEGESMYLIQEMDDWAKVRSKSGYIGYVEKKHYQENGDMDIKSVTGPEVTLEYTNIAMDKKVNMAFHQVFGEGGNATFDSYIGRTKGVNVVAPTWYRILDDEGTIEDISSQSYVNSAHALGMQVWAVWTDVDYQIDMTAILHDSQKRKALVDEIVTRAKEKGIDGVNIDFETVKSEAGEDFEQFLRELSIQTHAANLVLSVDNYAPTASTMHYNRTEQGKVADYVIVMGYDEHWSTSKEAGSVASVDFVEYGITATIQEVPAEKVINAIPFYTRIWKTSNGEVKSETVGIEAAKKWVEDNNITLEWKNDVCQYYGETTINGVLYQIWMEDKESIQVKLSVMSTNGIAGVASWKLGLEDPQLWDAIQGYLLQE